MVVVGVVVVRWGVVKEWVFSCVRWRSGCFYVWDGVGRVVGW